MGATVSAAEGFGSQLIALSARIGPFSTFDEDAISSILWRRRFKHFVAPVLWPLRYPVSRFRQCRPVTGSPIVDSARFPR